MILLVDIDVDVVGDGVRLTLTFACAVAHVLKCML